MPELARYAPSPFVEELQRLLTKRHLSWRKLAELTNYHPSWLSKIRHGAPPSADLVRRCDDALEARGALVALAAVRQTRRPAQLPAPPSGFVGRQRLLEQMRGALTKKSSSIAPIIVAIDGPPGVGKTAAALRCAHDVVGSDAEIYPDGQLYVDLRGYSQGGVPIRPDDVLEEFLVALGVPPDEIPEELEQRAKLYRSLLASRRLLIVLDNAASSEQVEPLLPGSSGCGVLLTGRRRLTGLAMRVAVERVLLGPLTEQESVDVLRTVIEGARADAEVESLTALARWCGHLPLALRIAAERAAVYKNHPVSELVEELAAERHRLDALVTDDSVAVRTAFEWSYRALGRDEAQMFQRLGLHRGPHISVEAAAALAGVSPLRARHLLQRLVAVHLLEGAPDSRYSFHDLLRVYAVECLEAESTIDSRNASVRRLVGWYLHSAVAASRTLAPFRVSPLVVRPLVAEVVPLTFDSDQEALQWCDIETPNFVSVIKLAVDCRLYEMAWKLVIALFDYLRLLRKSGGLWLAASALAHKAALSARDARAQGWIDTSMAEAYRWLRQYDRSQQLFEQALALQQEAGDRHGQAWALAGLGFLAVDQGRLESAYEYAREALSLFQVIGDRHGQASAMITFADAYDGWQWHDKALDILQDSLKVFSEIENHDGQALTLAKIAETHAAFGEYEQALDYLMRSLQARRLAGSRWGEADALARRGRILQALGRQQEAREAWAAALLLYENVDDPRAANIRAYLQGDKTDPGIRILSRPAW